MLKANDTDQLVFDFVMKTNWSDLPADVQHQAKRCLLDLIGVAAAGSDTELGRIITQHAQMMFGGTSARMMFAHGTASAAGAALANGMSIDAIDAHDGHPQTKGHAGCGLLPALVAMVETQELDLTGAEFLTTLAIGYEVSIRAGIALHDSTTDYHTSGAWVVVGIAAMSARILNLNYEQYREAIGIAEYHGPRSQMMRCIDAPTMLKDGSGWGAMAGVSAAYLAQSGFTGAPAITIEGREEFSDLGSRWTALEQYFKPYPVCRWAQPASDAAKEVMDTNGFDYNEIEAIDVTSFHEATRLAIGHPRDTEQAQYNLPFAVAAMLVFGQLGGREIGPMGLNSADVKALMERISLRESADYNQKFPDERWAHVSITLKDGRSFKSAPSVGFGNAENPLSDAFLNRKFDGFLNAIGAKDRGDQIKSLAWSLDEESSVKPLINLIMGAS